MTASRPGEILGTLLYVTPEEFPLKDLALRAIEGMRGGITSVQVRRKQAYGWEFSELVRIFRDNVPSGFPWLVNQRMDFALAGRATGLHLPEAHPPISRIRLKMGERASRPFLVGVSVHSLESALAAVREGADYLIAGPVFETSSKVSFGPPLGLERLGEIVREVPVPVWGIGGIGVIEAPRVRNAGAFGMAVMGALSYTPDPVAAAFALRKAWNRG